MHVKQYIKNLERKRCSDPLTGDEQAACKEEGNNHKKPKEDASLDYIMINLTKSTKNNKIRIKKNRVFN